MSRVCHPARVALRVSMGTGMGSNIWTLAIPVPVWREWREWRVEAEIFGMGGDPVKKL